MDFSEKTITSEKVYAGKIMDVYRDEIELAADVESSARKSIREVVKKPNAAAIVAMKDKDTILMIKQFRYPVGEVMFEIPAGIVNKGETPLECAKRELEEETGYVAQDWKDLGFIYTSAGFCDEKVFLFLAENLIFKKENPDEGEIIECHEFPLNEVFDMIYENRINDSKTLAGLLRAFKQ